MLHCPHFRRAARAILATGSFALSCDAQGAQFEAPRRLRSADGRVIDCGDRNGGGYAAPALHDIDGDGVLDLIVGQFNAGRVRVYRGRAMPKGRPSFDAPVFVRAAGELFAVPMG